MAPPGTAIPWTASCLLYTSLLPRKVENPELKSILRDYFRIRSEKVKVEESIAVYKDAAERFGDE